MRIVRAAVEAGRRRRAASRFLRDSRASTAIEFGIVATPFLAIIFGAIQISLLFFAGQALETFTETTGRDILVGLTQQNNFSQAQFKASLCAQLPSMFKCSSLYVDVTTVASFASANTSAPALTYDASGNVNNNWNYNLGNPGDIVVLRLMYLWPVFGLPNGIKLSNQTNGGRLLMATAVFQNEAAN